MWWTNLTGRGAVGPATPLARCLAGGTPATHRGVKQRYDFRTDSDMIDGERESGLAAQRIGSHPNTASATRCPRVIRVGDQVEAELSDGLRGRAIVVAIRRGPGTRPG
jgi:hypothetical protein